MMMMMMMYVRSSLRRCS